MNVAEIADRILRLALPHPVRVGVDGFCAAGKTTLVPGFQMYLDQVRPQDLASVVISTDGLEGGAARWTAIGRQ